MYERFYGLRERPFDLTPNPRFLYLTGGHAEALSNLQYGITGRKGMTLLIGEAGTGKTTLVRAAIDAVAGPSVRCVYLNNPVLTREEFYEFLARKFELSAEAAASKARFLFELEAYLAERHRAGGLTALVIDEAQSLPHELLEEVRLLANFETETDKLLPVVLAGQPELAARLEHERLRQLKQRVALRCDLAPLDARETASYISGRIAIAGGDASKVFTREAVQVVYERSGGIPRTISVICDNALLNGFAVGVKPVGSPVVLEVCRDFRLPQFRTADLDVRGQKEEEEASAEAAAVEAAAEPEPVRAAARGDGRVRPPREENDERAVRPKRVDRPDRGLFSHYSKKKRFRFFG